MDSQVPTRKARGGEPQAVNLKMRLALHLEWQKLYTLPAKSVIRTIGLPGRVFSCLLTSPPLFLSWCYTELGQG